MGVLPWSHHALGDLVDAPEGAPATYTNYWGYEIELLRSIAGALNFKYDIVVNLYFYHHSYLGTSSVMWRMVSGVTLRRGLAGRNGTGWWHRSMNS